MLCALALAASLLFPNVHARALTGQAIETTQQRGVPIVYLIGFTPDSRNEADAWKRAVATSTGGALRAIKMPVLSGFAVYIRPVIEGSMTRRIPEAERGDIQVTTERDALVAGLRLPTPDAGCVVVLVDAKGEVRYTTQGAPTDEAEAALRAAWERVKGGR